MIPKIHLYRFNKTLFTTQNKIFLNNKKQLSYDINKLTPYCRNIIITNNLLLSCATISLSNDFKYVSTFIPVFCMSTSYIINKICNSYVDDNEEKKCYNTLILIELLYTIMILSVFIICDIMEKKDTSIIKFYGNILESITKNIKE